MRQKKPSQRVHSKETRQDKQMKDCKAISTGRDLYAASLPVVSWKKAGS